MEIEVKSKPLPQLHETRLQNRLYVKDHDLFYWKARRLSHRASAHPAAGTGCAPWSPTRSLPAPRAQDSLEATHCSSEPPALRGIPTTLTRAWAPRREQPVLPARSHPNSGWRQLRSCSSKATSLPDCTEIIPFSLCLTSSSTAQGKDAPAQKGIEDLKKQVVASIMSYK